jgi:hypothetical protein
MKMMISASIICLFVAFAGAYDVPRLTPDNYDEMTNGKTVFLKFFAPGVGYFWCGSHFHLHWHLMISLLASMFSVQALQSYGARLAFTSRTVEGS